jgi:G3E family GTPase
MLKRLPNTVYRVKGIVYMADSPEQRGVLQMVGKRATIDVQGGWSGEPGSNVVFIGADGSVDRDALNEQMMQCLAENVPDSQIGRLARAVTGWLRGPR